MTKDMRQILDSLNGKQIVEESSSESPFKGFRQWALNEAWPGEPASTEFDVNVFQDRDPMGEGKWFWRKSRDGHTYASGVADTEEEANTAAYGPVVTHPDNMVTEQPVMHLLRPHGGTECGEPCDEHNCTAEINDVDCPACIEGHDAYMRQYEHHDDGELHEGKLGKFGKIAAGAAMAGALAVPAAQIAKNAYTYGRGGGFSHAGMSMHDAEVNADFRDIGDKMKTEDEDLEESEVGNAEDHLDRMFNHHMAGHDDFVGQYDFWKGVNEDEELDEAIEAEIETGPAAWMNFLINGDAEGLSPEDLAACDAWQKKIEPWYVVSVEDGEPRFTWSYRLYGGTASGGDVVDYIIHKDGSKEAPVEEDVLDEPAKNYDAFERNLVSAVTRYDRTRRNSNPNALGIYLQRVEEIMEKIRAGENWHVAVTEGFNDRLRDYVISFLEKAGHRSEENAFVRPELEEGWDEFEDNPHVPEGYQVYRNKNFTKRDYETSNIVACVAPYKPETEDDRWVRAVDPDVINKLTMLYRQGDVRYFGYL